ncbi:hypothetical protein CR513_42581, partial [Mucuna pruriens]
MVTYELTGYALVWWNQFYREIREGRRRHVDTWANLKREMWTWFILVSYTRDLYNKLQWMYQGLGRDKPILNYGRPSTPGIKNKGTTEKTLNFKENLPQHFQKFEGTKMRCFVTWYPWKQLISYLEGLGRPQANP